LRDFRILVSTLGALFLKWRPPALPWLPVFNVGANYSNIIDLIAET